MTETGHGSGIFGHPPHDLVEVPKGALQVSPLIPGASPLAALPEGSLTDLVMLAPPGTLERRRALGLALKAVRPGGRLTALAPKDKGGARIAKELKDFGCAVEESVKNHHRIVTCLRPEALADEVETSLAEGAMRFVEETGFWSQPGVFSWDRIDPGSAFLAEHLPPLTGAGADLGCGYGFLAREVLANSPAVTSLTLIDIDGRAVEAARHNIPDPRARFLWSDLRKPDATSLPKSLDFIVMNAPFHDGGAEDRRLLAIFLERAAGALRNGGVCWLVANRHLPYEAAMAPLFQSVTSVADARGFKVFEAKVERDLKSPRKSEAASRTRATKKQPANDGDFDLDAFLAREGLDPRTMREPPTARKTAPKKPARRR